MNLLPCVLILHAPFVDYHMIKTAVRQNASLCTQYPQTTCNTWVMSNGGRGLSTQSLLQHASDEQWLEYTVIAATCEWWAMAWIHGHCCNTWVMSNGGRGLSTRSLLHPFLLHTIAGREVGNNQIVTTSLLAKCPPSPIVCPPVPSTFQYFSHNLCKFPINHGHTDPQYLPLGRRACLHHCVVILTIGSVDKAFCVDRGSIRIGLSKVMKDFPRGSDWFGLAHMVASLHTMREYILYWH